MANDLPLMQYSGNELLDALIPKKPAKTTTTTKKDISAQGMDRFIQQQLQRDANFAAIARQESGAGLYNSTVAEKLANDLAVRNAGEAALLSAPTIESQVVEPAQRDPLGVIGSAIAGDIFNNGGSGIGKMVDTVTGLFGGGASAAGQSIAAPALSGAMADTGFGMLGDTIGSIFGNIGSTGGATAGILGGLGSTLGATSSAGLGSAAASGLASGFGGGATGAGAAGLFGEAGALGGLGNLGGLAPILGPVAIIGGLLSLFGGKKMSIICTELHKQGKLTKMQYARGWAKVAKDATMAHRVGYFTFAPRVLARIKKHPQGIECKMWAWFFKRRARNDLIGKALTAAFSKYCEHAGNKVLA